MGSTMSDRTVDRLTELLGGRMSTVASVLVQHGHDESYHPTLPPDAVAYPTSTGEVAAIVKVCAEERTPVIPFGAGTALEGHVCAVRGGVALDMTQMNEILAVNVDDLDCTVQAGVTRLQLDERVRREGLFFPVDPGADATLGGMAATRASGTNAVRYGTMRENVLGLVAVMADGSVVRTSRRARKSAAGYDLTRLLIGSEGTLGVICELTLRLYGVPEAITSAVCTFERVEDAVTTVIRAVQLGVPLARAELCDEVQIEATNAFSGTDLTVAPTLFFEFHGTEASAAEAAEIVEKLAAESGGSGFRWAADHTEREQLWKARHDAYYAALASRPGSKGFVTDVCVPVSALPACVAETRRDLDACSVPAAINGHIGDGNFHIVFLVDPERPEELDEVQDLNERLVQRALDADGTCTGEHGIGLGKIGFLEAEHGPGVDVMRAVKAAIDPKGIMNPGKLLAR